MKFGEKVRENRLSLHLTQEELGNLVGVSKRSILAYETQGIRPRTGMLRRLASALGVSERYMEDDTVDDPLTGLEHSSRWEETKERFTARAEREIRYLMGRNAALFAESNVPQEQKDAYFEAVMRAYLAGKSAGQSFGRKRES